MNVCVGVSGVPNYHHSIGNGSPMNSVIDLSGGVRVLTDECNVGCRRAARRIEEGAAAKSQHGEEEEVDVYYI